MSLPVFTSSYCFTLVLIYWQSVDRLLGLGEAVPNEKHRTAASITRGEGSLTLPYSKFTALPSAYHP